MKRPWQSLRVRLTIALLVGFAALVSGTAWWMESTLSTHLARDFDQNLLAKANHLATLVEQENGVVEFDYVARFQPEFERADAPDYFQIWLGDGLELMRSRWLAEDLGKPGPLTTPAVRDTTLANGRRVRQVTMRFTPKSPSEDAAPPLPLVERREPLHEIVMAVARGREPLDTALQGLHGAIVLTTLLATLLGVALIGGVVAFGLRPVRAIADQVGRLGTDQLEARIDAPNAPTELAPIAQQVNALLARLQEARQRERRFAGNVAHELRTPVAELRSLANVAVRWPDDTESVRGFFGDVSHVARRMEGIIGDLLLLARIQGGVEHVVPDPIPVRALVAEVVARHGNRPGAPRLRLDVDARAVAMSDHGKLTIVLDNLIGNACAYHRPGTDVTCRGGVDADRFWLEVENKAEPLDAADMARLCEPFWRRDEARSAPDHAGLGLALVAAIGRLLQLEIRFTQDSQGVFVARIQGPAVAAALPTARILSPTPLQKPA